MTAVKKLFVLYCFSVCGLGSCTWVSLYETGSSTTPVRRLVLSQNAMFREIEELASNEKWKLPIHTGKLTYPLWEHIRFTADGERVLIPTELALGCLFNDKAVVQDATGRKRCFSLVIVDCKKRKEIAREDVNKADVIKFGWVGRDNK
jgi:hypothetical protein